MNRQYYYLVAGLPDLLFDDKKVPITVEGFRDYLKEFLSFEELRLLNLHFWRYDNQNIVNRLTGSNLDFDTRGNLTAEGLDEVFEAAKEISIANIAPGYIFRFIDAFKNESPIFEGKPWDVQLAGLYYQFASNTGNNFINRWFDFELNLNNVLTALNCRAHAFEISKQLAGYNEVTEKLIKSNARDFGLSDEILHIDKILRAAEEPGLLEREKKIDLLKWEILDEESFFHYFSIEKLFVFTIKLTLAERWIKLDKPTGEKMFNELLNSLEASYNFPAEFSLK
ncbi:MAG: DUF2764 family protein [Bacteroidales bacterium]|nr:DUF2764 family protein [Bacteroidales bacterium]